MPLSWVTSSTSLPQVGVTLLGELDDLDREPLMLSVERREVSKENLGIDVPAKLLHFDGLFPEVEHADRVLQHLHDAQHELLERRAVVRWHHAAVVGELQNVVVEGGRLLREALHDVGAPDDCVLAEL